MLILMLIDIGYQCRKYQFYINRISLLNLKCPIPMCTHVGKLGGGERDRLLRRGTHSHQYFGQVNQHEVSLNSTI